MNLRKLNDEVFVALDPIVKLGREELAFLKQQAAANARKRARICAHQADEDILHEMIIAISAESYIQPHRHLGKSESFHIIEGEVDVVVFNDAGKIIELVELGDSSTGRNFFYRLSQSAFHTLLIRTDFLIVHEVTNGPFLRGTTLLARFAPTEEMVEEAKAYVRELTLQAAQYKRAPHT